eukprot:1733151-Alexandrium_andersonii.AAC.1
MSASLVGSEMCIRDSLATSPPTTSGTRCACATPPVTTTSSSRAPRARPVSYTHLTLPTICSV